MTMEADEVDALLAFHARYFAAWSQVTRTPRVWYFDSPDLPDYRSANCALRLRVGENESDPARVMADTIGEIVAHFRARGLPVVADVDPIAEAQGWGRELRRRGVTPVVGSTLLMRRAGQNHAAIPADEEANEETDRQANEEVNGKTDNGKTDKETNTEADSETDAETNTALNVLDIRRVPNDPDDVDTQVWIALAGMEEELAGHQEEAAFWRAVALREANAPDCRLYLATWGGQAAGACQWFAYNGWMYLDSVATHPAFRRRGIATRLVTQAVQDALAQGNTTLTLFTDRGGAGEQVYRRLGFETWGIDVLRRHILW